MNIELYERLSNLKFGIRFLAVGLLAMLVCMWIQFQRIEVLDLKVQKLEKQLAVAMAAVEKG